MAACIELGLESFPTNKPKEIQEEEETGEGNAEEDLQNQIDAMEQYQADKLAGKKPCKGGETKRNENFVEQRVKKEDGSIEPESMGMCFLFDCGGTLF